MACGMIALQNLGVKVDNYYAYEIDKYCIQTAQHNFPFIKELGDVFNADFTQYEGQIFCQIGGSPCTYWSIAQSVAKRETTASGQGWELFNQYVRALDEAKPKYFLYENNKSMSNAIRESITSTFGFEPYLINSELVSAQNRQRLYWIGERQEDGTYKRVEIELPEDKGLIVADVLDENKIALRETARCVLSSCGRTTTREFFKKHQGNMAAIPLNITSNGKSQTIKAQYQQTSPINICKYTSTYGATGKAIKTEENAPESKGHTKFKVTDGYVDIRGNKYPISLDDGWYYIVKLTVDENKRLQTIPDWYEFPVSDCQAYKMIGNGWTVDVIAHILSFIFN